MEIIQIKRFFDEILTFLTEENTAIAESLDDIKVVDILAMFSYLYFNKFHNSTWK